MSSSKDNVTVIRENILHLTHSCLSHQISNEQRQAQQNELFQMESNCNPKDFLEAANRILLDVEYAVNTQNFTNQMGGPQNVQQHVEKVEAAVTYCAQAITRWLSSGHAPAEEVRFLDMHAVLTGHLCLISNLNQAPPPLTNPNNTNEGFPIPRLQSPLRRVHSVSLSKTILACAKHLFPEKFPSLFEPFFNISDRKNVNDTATFTPLLQSQTDAWQLVEFYICNLLGLDELHPGPKHLVELEKRALQAVSRNAHGIIACLFGAMENFPNGVDNIPLPIYTSLMNIIESLVPHCKPEILTGRPAQLVLYGLRNRTKNIELVSACGSLFAAMCAKRGIITESARGWLREVIDSLDGLLANQMWDSISCFLEGFEELPLDSLQNVAPEVADLAGKVLRTQSLFFSHKMLPILNKLVESALQQGVKAIAEIIPNDLVQCIYELAPRGKSHPRFAGRFRSADMSELQFVSDDQYDFAFGEFRGYASKLLKMYATIAPQKAAQTIQMIMKSELRPPDEKDNRNRNNHVTMDSPVFFTWDGCHFCIDHMAHCFEVEPKFSAGPVQPVWDSLVGTIGKNLTDAVLCPLYLNMMASLWKAPDVPWLDSIDLLLHYSALKPQNNHIKNLMQDQDLLAARRRALTLLVRVCTDHGQALSNHYEELWKKMQALQMSGVLIGSESNFLLEAAASLSCSMSDQDQANFLNNFVSDPAQRIINLGTNCNTEKLRDVIFASGQNNNNAQFNPEQQALIDDLGLIVGITRRVAGKNYARNLMQNLIGPISSLTVALHELHATVPPQFAAAFELPEEVADAMNQQGNSRHGAVAQAHSNHNVDPGLRRIRNIVSKLRVNLYHLLPIAMKIFGSVTDQIAFCLNGIQMASLPLHVAKAAVDNLFCLAVELYPPCLPLCVSVVGPLFVHSAQRHNSSNAANQQQHNNQNNYNNNNNSRNNYNNNNNNSVMISRQLYFIYKNFMNAIRNHIITPKLHTQNRELCVAIVQFLTCVMGNCPDALFGCAKDAASIVADIPDDQVAAQLFIGICQAIGGPGQGLSKRDLEMIAGDAFNVYQKHFNRFSSLLHKALPPQYGELINRFHGSLSALQRFFPKRARFIEFCTKLVG